MPIVCGLLWIVFSLLQLMFPFELLTEKPDEDEELLRLYRVALVTGKPTIPDTQSTIDH